jgi:hypothetical protein
MPKGMMHQPKEATIPTTALLVEECDKHIELIWKILFGL